MAKRRTTVKADIAERPGVLTWEDAVGQFIDSMKIKGLAYHTMRWHKENLLAVLKSLKILDFPTDPGLVNEKMLREVVLRMVDGGLSPTTINHRVRSIKQFYQYLTAEALVSDDPAERLERKKSKNVVIETFTEEQLNALLAAANKDRFVGFRDYTMMLLLLDTGVRLSELAGIKLSDIRMGDSEIIIPWGKGGKSRRVFFYPKTREVLKKYLRIRGEIPGNPYLLVNAENEPMKNRNVQERLTIYGRKAKIKGVRVSPHTFRHTFARMYIMSGGDPFSLQELLGHSSLEMVRVYVRLWGSDLQKMHRKYSPVGHLFR